MNSLYGRFGIIPLSSKTHIGYSNDLKRIMAMDTFVVADVLGEDSFVMSYKENVGISSLHHWNPFKDSAVQLSAAITASARIHMYPYISRDDCHYNDTDSIVLGKPLNEEDLSQFVLGKFKEEAQIVMGVFLGPKQYYFKTKDDKNILKHKGPAKEYVKKELFEEIYKNPFDKLSVTVTNLFAFNKTKFEVKRTERPINVGISFYKKRIPLFNDKGRWIGSIPREIYEDPTSPPFLVAREIKKRDKAIKSTDQKIKDQEKLISKLLNQLNQLDENKSNPLLIWKKLK
ncbi:DNA polymerase [Tanacetum coccineum]